MSTARKASSSQPIPAAAADFAFPSNHYLLITCPSKILSWDSGGINTVFQSGRAGIVAAREAKDGSGTVAIADKQIVVLHDTKRKQEKSWGLHADEDEIRILEYTADAKSLFLSTNLTADIQRYSTETSKLLDPTNIHSSPPVALAISATGHALVSASDNPPTLYLKNLAHNSSPILIEPRASRAAACVIAFHPERANIFLVAFRDGSVSAYDTTRIGRNQGGQLADQQSVGHGQFNSFTKLHRATNETSKFPSITGAAFLPGFKTRAITVGSDGRCRIVDFAGKGEILRTWHAKAPVTSVSVLPLKDPSIKSPFARARGSRTIGGPTSTENLIAIGRADGVVHLYNAVGLLLLEKPSASDSERILSLEWVKGSSPRPIAGNLEHTAAIQQAPAEPAKSLRRKANERTMPTTASVDCSRDVASSKNLPPRRFTIHPDEADEGTVRHTPKAAQPQALPSSNGPYLDLFSPMKPSSLGIGQSKGQLISSPGRSRPRVSSQTFVRSPMTGQARDNAQVAKPRNLALFPSTDETEDTVSATIVGQTPASGNTKPLPSAKKTRITWRPSERRRSRKSAGFLALSAKPDQNAKVLADIRKMSAMRRPEQSGGVLTAFRPMESHHDGTKQYSASSKAHARATEHIETDLQSLDAFRVYDSVRREKKWPADSEQGDDLGADIWLTSESGEDNTRRSNRRRPNGVQRPPARQTSRSRITSKGTVSTADRAPGLLRAIDGSTEEDQDAMTTARSQVSASGNFSPSSNDVRQLFPRTSSLSPRKHKTKHRSPAKRMQRPMAAPETDKRTPREMTLNTAHVRPTKSPWSKMKATKSCVGPVLHPEPPTVPRPLNRAPLAGPVTDGTSDGDEQSPEAHCTVCGPTQARVTDLEGDVMRLRGEVLALKAVLRRNGLQVPRGM